jgi:hypothetical protein
MGRILWVTFALVREAGWSIVISERNAWVSSTLLHSVFFGFDLFQPTLFRWMCFFEAAIEHSQELEPGMIDSLLCILLECGRSNGLVSVIADQTESSALVSSWWHCNPAVPIWCSGPSQ